MIAMLDRLRPAAAACALAFHIASAPQAFADDASRWDGDTRSAIRLIAGSRTADTIRAGIEIRLKAGWHTYWRYPGDAGVPPRFDFEGSQNAKSITVRWPAPRRLPEGALTAIGYDRDVILPVTIVPQDPAKPVVLRLKLDYAVCEKLCVPVDGKAELAITGKPSTFDSALAAAEARVPKKIGLGGGAALSIQSIKREGSAKPRIFVTVVAPKGAPVELFAEGPTDKWALPVPTTAPGAPPGTHRFVFDLDGAPPGAKYDGALVTFTAVAGNDAIEVATRLD